MIYQKGNTAHFSHLFLRSIDDYRKFLNDTKVHLYVHSSTKCTLLSVLIVLSKEVFQQHTLSFEPRSDSVNMLLSVDIKTRFAEEFPDCTFVLSSTAMQFQSPTFSQSSGAVCYFLPATVIVEASRQVFIYIPFSSHPRLTPHTCRYRFTRQSLVVLRRSRTSRLLTSE